MLFARLRSETCAAQDAPLPITFCSMKTEAMLIPAVWKSNPDDSILQPLQFDVFRPGVLLLKAQEDQKYLKTNDVVLTLLNSGFQVGTMSLQLKSVEDMQIANMRFFFLARRRRRSAISEL